MNNMIRINSAYYYEIGAAIHPLIDLPFEAKLDYLYLKLLYHAADNLDNLLNFNMVHTSHTNAKDLLHHIELLLKKYNDSEDKERQFSLYDIIKSAQSFESVYKAELQISNIYAVTPKGGYSIDILTLSPKNLFPEDLLKFFPDTKYDIEQSARCLAFEIPTAAVFHLMKILESVIRKYYLLLTKESDESNNKSMGIYLTKLENTADADQILISSLKQIKKLHRNPIAHPDINLTVQETINLFGITISAISYLLDSIDKITNKENN